MNSAAPDRDFEEKLARVFRREISGFKKITGIERLTGGANQETYRICFSSELVDQTLAMRRAAGGSAQQTSEENIGLANEARLMQIALAHHVPAPQVLFELQETDGLGSGFVMHWLAGETRGARIVRQAQFANLRRTLAYECGVLLAKIHAIDIKRNKLDTFLPERTPESFVCDTWARYRELETPQPMLDYTAQWLLQNLPTTSRKALVHNDFRNGNLMVSAEKIVAVLDWEVAHLGDPYRDLGWICTGSWRFGASPPVGGFGEREDLYRGYEAQSGEVINRKDAKFWEVFGSFWWGVGCLMMASQYRDGPDPSVERPGIGRRSSECQMDCANLLIPGPVEPISYHQYDDAQLPTQDELLGSVVDFLRGDVMPETAGRVQFLARVAANSLEIARREQQLGPGLRKGELNRLQALLGAKDDLRDLRWRLVETLRAERPDLNDPQLCHHLRQSAYEQLAIDQPAYPAFATATQHP